MKRFTESEKWTKSPWFRRLHPTLKLGYLYLLDTVDNAGVWDPDFEAAQFAIGVEVDWDELQKALGDRLDVLPSGKWYLTNFIAFQCGTLHEKCIPHQKVLSLIASHGITLGKSKGKAKGSPRVGSRVAPTIGKELTNSTHNHTPKGNPTLKEEEEEEEEDNQGSAEGGQASPPPPTIEDIYVAYPRKQGKADALNAIAKALKRGVSAERLLERTHAYATATDAWPEDDRRYIPHPATWFNRGSYDDDPGAWVRFDPSKPKPTPVADLPDNVREFLALRDGNANA